MIQPLLQTVLHPTHMNNPSWPQVVRRLKKHTVREFSDCGQCLLVKIQEQHFLVRDGAHDIYTYELVDDCDLAEYTNTPLDQLVEEFETTPPPEPKKSERKTLMMILDTKRQAFHFCGTKLQGDDIWFAVNGHLYECVEKIMTLNKVAHNVAYIECIRTCGNNEDYEITYNTSREV